MNGRTGLLHPDQPMPNGISGYLLTYWKVSDPIKIYKKLGSYQVAQIQGLEYNQDYKGYVQSIGFFGELSNPSNTIIFRSAPPEFISSLKTRYNGFFDSFDRVPLGTMGGFDGKKWAVAYSEANAPMANRGFINSQQHAHNLGLATFGEYDALYDRGSNTNRVLNAVFDLSDNGEREVIVSTDAPASTSNRSAAYIDFTPLTKEGDVDIQSFMDLFDGPGTPAGRI